MSVRNHRIAAVTFLTVGTLIVFGWARSQANDPAPIQAVRDRLDGEWVATSVQVGLTAESSVPEATATRVTFAGKSVAFRGLTEGDDARGTYFLDPAASPAKVDFKLDAGWIVAVYELAGDRLILNLVPLALPERLGVPTRYRARSIEADKHHNRYVFRRATP